MGRPKKAPPSGSRESAQVAMGSGTLTIIGLPCGSGTLVEAVGMPAPNGPGNLNHWTIPRTLFPGGKNLSPTCLPCSPFTTHQFLMLCACACACACAYACVPVVPLPEPLDWRK